jgi:asparagine synthase (glutamine-hydrolysing)
MPGIYGIISQKPAQECHDLVTSMARCLMHEPFYVSGTHSVPDMGVYGGWAVPEDSFAAGQTFSNEQKDIALLFSGECFKDHAEGTDLGQERRTPARNSGDWLVHHYEQEGNRFFEQLNGLFSGLLIDKRERKAFLFNDRYGVERIYWHRTDDAFYFASEAKALLRILPELRAFDGEGVAQFLNYGCTLDWRTLFRGVELLPGASVWSFENGKCHKRKYFSPATWETQSGLSVKSFESEFQETFKRVLPRYFESAPRIGISLTGGLDSRMIMACLPQNVEQPVCYTFAGREGRLLDARLAARAAKACGLEHHILRIGPDFFSDFASHADRTVYVTDGCFGILGSHEIYLNKQAHELAPVRITGNYGSEVLRGMSTFKRIGLSSHLFDPAFGHSVDAQAQALIKKHPVTFAAFQEIPWNLFGSLAACRSQLSFRTPYLDNELVALAYRAPAAFRKSPLPALHLLERNDSVLAAIPTDMGLGGNWGLGSLWRRLAAKATFKLDYFSNEGLPHMLSPLDKVLNDLNSRKVLVGHHKYLRYRSWLRKELAHYLRDSLAVCGQSPFWNAEFVRGLAERHIAGRSNYIREINAVLTLSAVERTLLRATPEHCGQELSL